MSHGPADSRRKLLEINRWWFAQIRGRGATEQEIAEAEYRMQTDLCSSVEDQLRWMRDGGFADADCWFKQGRFAVLAGSREA